MLLDNKRKNKKGLILFIEDESNLVDMYHEYLLNRDYDFLSTSVISEALAISELENPDAVLLDIIIPKEEDGRVNLVAEQGYDYLRAVKKNPKTKNIPVIVFTNLSSDEDREKCRKLGAAAYVFKRDTAPAEVLEVINKVIIKK